MSILIKGIDMPSRIDLDFHDNHIVLGGVLYPIDIDQLVYIPTPHGRLIDWDAFNSKLDIQYAEGRGKALAPTILEEEK